MTHATMPVTPEVLKWAREHAGFTMDDATEQFPKYNEWERGQSFPTYPQLEQLARYFQISTSVFFFPHPPDVPAIRESFRTLTAHEFNALPPRIRLLLRKAKTFQINLHELNDGKNPVRRPIFRDCRFSSASSVRAHADSVREYLSHTTAKQRSWPNAEYAFNSYRALLEQHGVAVFKDAFHVDEYSGFCLYDNEFPLIYVNNSAKTRQIFTLFHELAHLLFQTSGLDSSVSNGAAAVATTHDNIERSCYEFAVNFLLPRDDFDPLLEDGPYTRERAGQLANQFKVSRELIYRGFLDRHLITNGEYVSAAQHWSDQRSTASGGNYYHTKLSYLGTNYTRLAFRRYNERKISVVELADYLDIKERNLNKFEDVFLDQVS